MDITHAFAWPRRAAPPWLKAYAQIGIATLSSLYLAMGSLTALFALGWGGEKADHKDVLPFLLGKPFGQGLVLAAAVGLLGYVGWRIYLTVADPDPRHSGTKGLFIRAGYLVSALFHAGLAWYAVRLLLGNGQVADREETVTLASLLLRQPHGFWWVALAAGILAWMGLFQYWKVWSDRYLRRIHDPGMISRHQALVRGSGTVGFTARGTVFLIMAYLFLQAGRLRRPSEAGGTEKAMGFLEGIPFGGFLLALVSGGLIAYGIFLAVQAWCLQDDLGG